MIDPIDGLWLLADVQRLAAQVRPPKIFLALLIGRLAALLECDRRLIELVLPESLHAEEPELLEVYDLPATYYVRRGALMDQIAAVLLFEPGRASRVEVAAIGADAVRGHALHGILLACRVQGESLAAKLDLEDMRRLVALYQDGGAFGWYVGLYAEELQRLLRIEAAFNAALV